MDIGNRLKELRVLKGLTQEELADRAELSKGFISQVERNLTSPSIATLTDILQCLGFTIGEFFSEEPEEQIEFGYILSGSVSIHLGSRTYKAKKGESFYFTPDKKHFLTSKNGAVVLWVSSPPSF